MLKYILIILILILFFNSCYFDKSYSNKTKLNSGNVKIFDEGTHYKVIINFNKTSNHRIIGREYIDKVLSLNKDFEKIADSYISDITSNYIVYQFLILRSKKLRKNLNKEYIDEIEGIASGLSGGTTNIRNDGKISIDELYLLNLLPDIGRSSQCSSFSVFSKRSSTGKTITARLLDWVDGNDNQLAKLQAVIFFVNGNKSISSIGYLGFMGILTGFNSKKIFAAIIDSQSGMSYSINNKRSYPFDLRYALENKRSINKIANYMSDIKKEYCFNHNIVLSDPNESKILENNISGYGTNMRRAIRTYDSKLNNNIKWGIENSIACVNSFVLKGNHDNHTMYDLNYNRWNTIRQELLSKGNTVSKKELKEIATYHYGRLPGIINEGDIYNTLTQQIIIFEPHSLSLEVFFHPKDYSFTKNVKFQKIKTDILLIHQK